MDLAATLNQSCHCITVDHDKLRDCLETGAATAGVHASILANQPHLFAASPVFLSREQLARMQAVVTAIETVVASEGFHAWAMHLAPPPARVDHGPRGVFLGYDFHLGADGPQLIEINTNAGGGLLNAALARAQQACCSEVELAVAGATCADPAAAFLEMFRAEWRLQRGGAAPLARIAIVDDDPPAQYLYPEFLLFQELFRAAGIAAVICDPRQLVHHDGGLWTDGARIDLVYNRLTDFALVAPSSAALASAYAAGDVVVTPNPHVYARYADKRHLVALSDAARLRAWGVADADVALLIASVPATRLVDAAEADALWAARKQFFFKPIDGYGGRAAYRGDKLTRGVWQQILAGRYIAQRLVPPSQRTIQLDGAEVPLKLDLRNYVYDGVVQLVAARLYQGQTTNFRTAGGGFAPVFTEA
ncbi:MAG: hypothetical protein SF182_03270 [Deltaproteobacteria bacterium]|nr:hypothetical protein [Deltaproteobacteria bacterium]